MRSGPNQCLVKGNHITPGTHIRIESALEGDDKYDDHDGAAGARTGSVRGRNGFKGPTHFQRLQNVPIVGRLLAHGTAFYWDQVSLSLGLSWLRVLAIQLTIAILVAVALALESEHRLVRMGGRLIRSLSSLTFSTNLLFFLLSFPIISIQLFHARSLRFIFIPIDLFSYRFRSMYPLSQSFCDPSAATNYQLHLAFAFICSPSFSFRGRFRLCLH